jgi:hypothetical protein
VDFAGRWVKLSENNSEEPDYRRKQLFELRNKLDSSQIEITEEIGRKVASSTDLRVATALRICRASFENLLALMHPKTGQGTVEPQIKYALSSDLLLVPGLPMTRDWEPQLSPEHLGRLLISVFANPEPHSWESATALMGENCRNLETMDRVIEYLEWEGKHAELLARLNELQLSQLEQCQGSLRSQIADCNRNVEVGVSLGLVREHQRAEYLDRINAIENRLASIRNFETEEAELRSIGAAIEDSRMREVDKVRSRIIAENIPADVPSFAKIQAAMDRGDVDMANEYVDMILRGDSLPDSEDIQDEFQTFFPKAAAEIDDYLSNPSTAGSLINTIENQKSIPGVEMRNIPGAQVQSAVAMLEAWTTLKRTKRPKLDLLKVFFERLGFTVLNLSELTTQRGVVLMDVSPLKHRGQCQLLLRLFLHGHYESSPSGTTLGRRNPQCCAGWTSEAPSDCSLLWSSTQSTEYRTIEPCREPELYSDR